MRASQLAWLAPLAAALGWIAFSMVHLAGYDFEKRYGAPIDYFGESAVVFAFVGIALTGIGLSRNHDVRSQWPARVVAIGAGLAIAPIVIGMMLGEEPGWYWWLMGPALLLLTGSLIALSFQLWSSGVAPRWALVLIVLTPLSIPAYWTGFAVVPALGWLGVAWGMAHTKAS